MERLLLIDGQDYSEDMGEIRRTAVRGVIDADGKYLFIQDKYGVLKLPGGGQEDGESDLDTLIREVSEETGLAVIPDTVRPFGYIEEKRLSDREPMIWHHISRIYFCSVEQGSGKTAYSESEQKMGMHISWYTINEALAIGKGILDSGKEHPWNEREYQTLLLLKKHLK